MKTTNTLGFRLLLALSYHAVLFSGRVAGAPTPMQLAREEDFSGQSTGIGMEPRPQPHDQAWKRSAPETKVYDSEDTLKIALTGELEQPLRTATGRKSKRQADDDDDAPVPPMDILSSDATESTTDETSTTSTDEGEDGDESLGNQTMEDLQELEQFYNSAREQILRTHKTRLAADKLKGDKSSSDDSDNMALDSSK